MFRPRLAVPLVVALLAVLIASPALVPHGRTITLATTTSTQDSGLLDFLIPRFTAETGIAVRVLAVGTGQALEIGRRGDADVVLTHAPAQEVEFLEAGYAAYRRTVMYNEFILVGPAGDPAGASGDDVALGLQRIAACECPFVSRGDDSGTHTKELELWRTAGFAPEPAGWYLEAGQGMGATLRIADQLHAYTLTDDGTYATMGDVVDLVPIARNAPPIVNQYGVMPINASLHPSVRFGEADAFARWLVDPLRGLALIATYEVGGRTVFTPGEP